MSNLEELKKKPPRVNICRSETWMGDDFELISSILEDTIESFVEEKETIINIEVKERNGLSRFWIYSAPSSTQ